MSENNLNLKNHIPIEDCQFYTVQNVPGLNEPTKGEWDLRENVDKYLGNTNFKGKDVLELGPASGFITFEIESRGASVTSVELSLQNDKWDIVPNCKINWKNEELYHRKNDLKYVQNAYWYTHNALNSNANVIYSHVNNISEKIGLYDISVMASVLLHLQNPFIALQNILSKTKEKAIVTDILPFSNSKIIKFIPNLIKNKLLKLINNRMPIFYFLPNSNPGFIFEWWIISPKSIVNIAKLFGFEKSEITYHIQHRNGNPVQMYTVVCERTIPIEDAYYK